jgi:hypothetical protein
MKTFVRIVSVAALLAGAVLVPVAGATPGLADTTNSKPWVAEPPIPPDPGGGAFSGKTEGACTSLIGGKIYVAFGFDPSGGDTHGLRIFDIASQTWSIGPSVPTAGRSEGYRGVAHGGKLYCVGGRPTAETWIFDTATNAWSPGAPEPDPALRAGATAATYGNSIFMFGGRHALFGPCTGPAVTPSDVDGEILRYDIDLNAWFAAGNMASPRSDTSVARVGSKIYIFGGCNGSAPPPPDVEVYDPRTRTSAVVPASFPGGPRHDAAAADPQNGSSANASHRIHVTGGIGAFGFLGASNHVIFDVDQQTFVVGVPMPTHCFDGIDRAEHETVYGGDRIHAVGGSCPAFGASLNNVDVQMLSGSDPPAPSASITASSCNASTFPVCAVQLAGSSLVFVTGTGFKPASTISLNSSLLGNLLPAVSDVQGSFVTTYLDTLCSGRSDTLTASDGTNTASLAFTCP